MTMRTDVVVSTRAQADVYRTPAQGIDYTDSYYFACKTCGNCGRRWTGRQPAIDEAITHVSEGHDAT